MLKIHFTTVEVVRGSVVDQDVDAIVNAANTGMRGGGGVDGAIHRAAGRELMRELERVAPHGARTGSAVVTGGHALRQKYVIHTPGPVWNGGNRGEAELLTACYENCILAAEEKKCASLGLCSISTGVYRYPIDKAAAIAVSTVLDYLQDHPATSIRRVVFAMFQETEYVTFRAELAKRAD